MSTEISDWPPLESPAHFLGRSQLSRRDALRYGTLGGLGLLFLDKISLLGATPVPQAGGGGKAKAVIQIWMWGGPPTWILSIPSRTPVMITVAL